MKYINFVVKYSQRLYNITDEERQELYAVVRNDRNPYGQDN